MLKLSLEQLQNNYRDRAEQPVAEILPVFEQVTASAKIPDSPAPVSGNKSSSAPLIMFLVLSGITMFVGLIMLITGNISSVDVAKDEPVLGESTVQTEKKSEVPVEALTKTNGESSPADKLESEYVGTEIQEPDENLLSTEDTDTVGVVEIVKILPNELNGVNLHISPNGRNKARAVSGEEFEFVSERDGWTEIRFDEDTTYWVLSELVEKL